LAVAVCPAVDGIFAVASTPSDFAGGFTYYSGMYREAYY